MYTDRAPDRGINHGSLRVIVSPLQDSATGNIVAYHLYFKVAGQYVVPGEIERYFRKVAPAAVPRHTFAVGRELANKLLHDLGCWEQL